MSFTGTGTVVWPPGTHTIQIVVPPGVDPAVVQAAVAEAVAELEVIVEQAKEE